MTDSPALAQLAPVDEGCTVEIAKIRFIGPDAEGAVSVSFDYESGRTVTLFAATQAAADFLERLDYGETAPR